jgi:hypothetical protein
MGENSANVCDLGRQAHRFLYRSALLSQEAQGMPVKPKKRIVGILREIPCATISLEPLCVPGGKETTPVLAKIRYYW